jgi:hypothetical protein
MEWLQEPLQVLATLEVIHPGSEAMPRSIQPGTRGASTFHHQLSDIEICAFADARQFRFTS